MSTFKLGQPVFVVVQLSKFMTRIVEGTVVAVDYESPNITICYSTNGIVHFASSTDVFDTRGKAENRVQEIKKSFTSTP